MAQKRCEHWGASSHLAIVLLPALSDEAYCLYSVLLSWIQDTRWLALRGRKLGLLISSAAPAPPVPHTSSPLALEPASEPITETFHFGCQRFSAAELEAASEIHHLVTNRGSGTSYNEPVVHVSLDHEMMGVGGDDSWSPRTHDEYLVISG